jgi:hypothetical protein
MVGHLAVSVTATQAGAGVNAVKVPALLVGGTVGVDDTLWPTCHVRVTEVVRDTSAGSGISLSVTDCIVTTRSRVAGVSDLNPGRIGGLGVAGREGVSNIARVTLTDSIVVVHRTGSVSPTHPRTGVLTLVVNASLVRGTVGVDGALMLALDVGVALETGEADTGSGLVPFPALCIDPTRRWVARIDDLRSDGGRWRPPTLAEGITNVALVADTDGDMVPDVAVGVDPTETRTWVLALPSDTGLVRGAVRVDHTLRSAVGWRTDHFRQAGTLATFPNHSGMVAVGAAGVGVTWIHIFNWFGSGRKTTCSEGVSDVVPQTDTVGDVVDHLALSIAATVCLWTGIDTVEVDTGQSGGTLCIGGALRPAGHIGVSEVIRDALTRGGISSPLTESIAAAGGGVAGVHGLRDPRGS